MCASKDPTALLNEYLTHLIDLLVSDHPYTRTVARDALGSELSHKLYNRVFKYLGEVIRDVTRSGHNTEWRDDFGVFLDQFLLVLKVLVEQVQSPDDMINAELMSILVSFAGFLSQFTDPACIPVRTKFCQLCDSTIKRSEEFAVPKDNLARQRVLEYILDWMVDPQSVC